jgi:hypothetical protein
VKTNQTHGVYDWFTTFRKAGHHPCGGADLALKRLDKASIRRSKKKSGGNQNFTAVLSTYFFPLKF